MNKMGLLVAGSCLLTLAGWYYVRGPKKSAPAPGPGAVPVVRGPVPARSGLGYQGRTAEEWARVLHTADRDNALAAGQALRVLRAEGRPYLLQGLDHPNPETRRICLENLSVSDLRAFGEDGRQALLRLAGDRHDLRIRERATMYLAQWSRAIPSPP